MPNSAPAAGVKRALDGDQLVLFYQPIHDLLTRAVVSAEALLRAHRGDGEIRSGVPIATGAEKGSDLFRLDSWTIHQAYSDAARWQSHGSERVHVNVNLSPREFETNSLTDRLRKLVTGCGIDTSTINLEITETVYIDHPKESISVLEELKDLGVQLWLDDFGSGHSSISHLLHFPLDGLKLPGSFIKPLMSDQRARAITRSIIELAHELGLKVVAEEVEDEQQLAFLREAKCDFIQGFLFSKPMPVAEFEQLLARSASNPDRRGS